MQITQEQREEVLVLKVSGRVDSHRATQLRETLEEAVSSGADQLRVDLTEVEFLSSAGVKTLMQTYRQVKGLRGSFGIWTPSLAATQTLDLMGTRHLLVMDENETARPAAALDRLMERLDTTRQEPPKPEKTLTKGKSRFDLFSVPSGTPLKASLFGKPERLATEGYAESDCWQVSYPSHVFGLGIGALGTGFADTRERFGEYLGAGGAIAALPTDGQNTPDYLLSLRAGVPEILSAYALTCEGVPSQLLRLESDVEEPTKLTTILEAGLEASRSQQIGFVGVLETVGMVGAALRQPPTAGKGASLQVPAVRDWVTFTAEPAWRKNIALVVGVAVRGHSKEFASVLRPFGSDPSLLVHIHSAIFSYHPLAKGVLELKTAVVNLFENHELLDVLHLLKDDRPIQGAGESEFTRGAIWIGSLSNGEEVPLP